MFEYLKPTADLTIKQGSINSYNRTVNRMYDDFKEFLVLHYMGGRTDSEFWKYLTSGATKTDFVNNIIEMSKSKMPTFNDFNEYYGAAGWPLWSWVLAGTNNLSADISRQELNWNVPGFGNLGVASETEVESWKTQTLLSLDRNLSYHEFIEHLKTHG